MIQPHKINLDHIIRTSVEATAFSHGFGSDWNDVETLNAVDWDDLICISACNIKSVGVEGVTVTREMVCEILEWDLPTDDDYDYSYES